jgi:hypothetical protein
MTTLSPILPSVAFTNRSGLSAIEWNDTNLSSETKQTLLTMETDKKGFLTTNDFSTPTALNFGVPQDFQVHKFTTFKNDVVLDLQKALGPVDDSNAEQKLKQKKTDLLHLQRYALRSDATNSREELKKALVSENKQAVNNGQDIKETSQISQLRKTLAQKNERLNVFESQHVSLEEPSFFLLKLLNGKIRTNITEPNYTSLATYIDGIAATSYGDFA